MIKLIKKIGESIRIVLRHLYLTCKYTVRLCLNMNKYILSESYYPEKKRKNRVVILMEQLLFIFKYAYINEQYFVYGFDVKTSKEQQEFLHYPEFSKLRDILNQRVGDFNYIAILRDKFVFHQYLKSLHIPTPEIIVLIVNGELRYTRDGSKTLADIFSKNIDAFCKKIDGECADEVFKLRSNQLQLYMDESSITLEQFKEKVKQGTYIIQERIIQHSDISYINKNSVNTIRLTTILNKKTNKADFFSATLRLGSGNSFVDNWAVGGLLININNAGELDEFGFFKPGFGTKVDTHPTSHIKFKGYKIPFYNEAIERAIYLHNMLYGIHSIGWDIAITENGPVFIEGNDNWELSVTQSSSKGMRNEFFSTIK